MDVEVRSLTVIPPWSLAIVRGWKPEENRGTNIAGNWRGRVLILSSKGSKSRPAWDQFGAQFIAEHTGLPMLTRAECHPGHYIGAADLVTVHWDLGHRCRPWGQPGVWHLVFENPVEFETPITAVGHLGLRKVTDPTLIRAALVGAAA